MRINEVLYGSHLYKWFTYRFESKCCNGLKLIIPPRFSNLEYQVAVNTGFGGFEDILLVLGLPKGCIDTNAGRPKVFRGFPW